MSTAAVKLNESQILKENEDLIRVCFLKLRYHQNKHLKEDLFQEGRIALVVASRSWNESRGAFRMFAWFCVRNAMVNFLRTHTASGEEGDAALAEIASPGLNPEQAYAEAEIKALVLASIQDLSVREQKVLSLHSEGLTQAEIGKQMSISQPQVHRIEREAVANLSKAVA